MIGFRQFFEPVDVIWHAGDFGGGISFADSIAAFKPLVGVAGNCDGQDIRREYPQHQYLEVQGKKVLMTHIGGSPGHYDLRAAALIVRTALRFRIEADEVKDMEVFELPRSGR